MFKKNKENQRFEVHSEEYIGQHGLSIITDKTTGVQYISDITGMGSGMTVLVDKDGKPLLNKET
ncbi:DUF6440 family protein [Companilactobacillus allii]|uniref:DUF6440 domain-containing protein n=1 Tax=Companilactobacillus allii TaxID=1847728 RepID=A0A1P8Q2C2_9LACO|nr:DUF6440 family protein [Companilactobacillus allii]APX72020.1 hypothetical protein BTM29_05350 [Companilactobacillus allii]USQ69113.1 DUF6440 family protein [Companilactobacillus allii]